VAVTTENPPFVRFGAVYFRKTNPPPEDWARDYAVAREDGHTLFRHWVAWNVVETAPGRFDWSDYDRQLDLAAENGIRTILAEFCIDTPEWLHAAYPHARREGWNGAKFRSDMHGSCFSGGHFTMCLDNPEVAEAAGNYLREMAARYRGHPGLMGYDIWNECTYYNRDRICYCPATQAKFRLWLEKKYGTLDALNLAWKRYSYTSWDQVELPREAKLFPDVLDAVAFQNDNAYALMQWRIEQIRSVDDTCVIAAHGNAKTHVDAAPACGDDWRAGELVDLFGYTFWYGNDCDPVFGGDMTRSAARGREFWRAEAVGDHDWLSRRRGDARAARQDDMHDPANIRLDCLISLMTGARAFQNPRWRPLLDGPFFGAFGWYDMDGSRTERSEMIRGLAAWANTPVNAALWRSRPVRGEVAVLLLDEAQAHCYAMHGDTTFYSLSVQGACEAFLDAGVQADVIKPDQIEGHDIVYVPYALSLSDASVARLKDWVAQGGTLIAEAGFGYFDDRAHAFPTQPSRGLDGLFGARQQSVHFGADRWADLDVTTDRGALPGGLHRQSFVLRGGPRVRSSRGRRHRHRGSRVRCRPHAPCRDHARLRLQDAAVRGWPRLVQVACRLWWRQAACQT
jgi:beta-galactosidase